MKSLSLFTALFVSLFILSACGGEQDGQNEPAQQSGQASGLSAFEIEHGIGPETEVVTLGEITAEDITKGKEVFKLKCSACHKVDKRYIGPELGTTLDNRSPTYVMNMILNPDGMVKKHPEARKLLAEFLSPMPNQNLPRDEALAIVKYLASLSENSNN